MTRSPKVFIGALVGALFGIGCCFATTAAHNAMSIGPNFPAHAGEDDFSLRFSWFFVAVLPMFCLIGVWIGIKSLRDLGTVPYVIFGAIVGVTIAGGVPVAFKETIEQLGPETSNIAAISSMVLHPLFMLLGAAAAYRYCDKRRGLQTNT